MGSGRALPQLKKLKIKAPAGYLTVERNIASSNWSAPVPAGRRCRMSFETAVKQQHREAVHQ